MLMVQGRAMQGIEIFALKRSRAEIESGGNIHFVTCKEPCKDFSMDAQFSKVASCH